MTTIRTVDKVEQEMGNNPGTLYSRTELRDKLKIDFRSLTQVLEWLETQKKVKKTRKEGVLKYYWI